MLWEDARKGSTPASVRSLLEFLAVDMPPQLAFHTYTWESFPAPVCPSLPLWSWGLPDTQDSLRQTALVGVGCEVSP